MTSRRDFIRQGALWVAGAALIEPKRLWAFPVNPAAPTGYNVLPPGLIELSDDPTVLAWADYKYRWELVHTAAYIERVGMTRMAIS